MTGPEWSMMRGHATYLPCELKIDERWVSGLVIVGGDTRAVLRWNGRTFVVESGPCALRWTR